MHHHAALRVRSRVLVTHFDVIQMESMQSNHVQWER